MSCNIAQYFVYLEGMDKTFPVADLGMDWVIVLAFLCVILLVAFCISVFLLREGIHKQQLYENFPGSVNEFIVVFSRKLEFIYGLPMYMSDPLFRWLSSGSPFQDLLESKDWARMKLYFDEVEKHQNMSFVFSHELESSSNGEKGRTQWYEMKTVLEYVSVQEFHYVCFIKNISKENENRKERERIQARLDNLLQNTGDFLWNYEVEDRRFKLLTPLMDEEHRVVPQSTGYVDIHKIMPESDIELLNSILNARVKDYHTFGSRGDPFETIKVRLYGPDKTLVWYCFRGRLVTDEENRLVLQGSARRMDMVLENSVFGDGSDKDAMLSAALSFPDVRIFWVDRDFNVQGCNQSFATDFQIMNPRETYGKSLDTVVNRKILPYMTKLLSEVFDSGRSAAWKGSFVRSDKLMMFNAVPIRSKDNITHTALGVYMLLDKSDFTDEVV